MPRDGASRNCLCTFFCFHCVIGLREVLVTAVTTFIVAVDTILAMGWSAWWRASEAGLAVEINQRAVSKCEWVWLRLTNVVLRHMG